MSESENVSAGAVGAGHCAAEVVLGRVDLLGEGSPPPPTCARLTTEEGAVLKTLATNVSVAALLSGMATLRLQTMACAVLVQVKLFWTKGLVPLKAKPLGKTSTTVTVPTVSAPPVFVTVNV